MLPLAVVKRNGYSAEVHSPMTDTSALDQSPDLINDTAAIKWKEQQQQVLCLVDGPYSSGGLYGHVVPNGSQYYPVTGPLSTISEAVYHQQAQYYNPSNNYQSAGAGMMPLNPGSYLPLVDAEGFPIDYGLPRPCRPTRPTQPHHHTVRFADPPSVSVRHYENYVLDGDQLIQPDCKYPDAYSLPGNATGSGTVDPSSPHSEYRYPSERYPEMSASPYPLPPPSGVFDEMITTPPKEFVYPPIPQQQQQQQQHSTSSVETSSENSTVPSSSSGAPSSPLDVSGDAGSSSSPAFLCSSSAIQRQPHESPDEGYEDEGVDGTEI